MAGTKVAFPTLSVPQAYQACTPDAPSPADYYPPLKNSIHASLSTVRDSSGPFPVKVINGSDGKIVHLGVSSVDTIDKLRAQLGPQWKDLSLSLNGKPVMDHQCLQDLRVKEGATFVTYHRCPGG